MDGRSPLGRGTAFGEEWSFPANWEGETAPTASTGIGTLTFPPLTSPQCTGEERVNHACYFSWNDLTGLSAESIQLDDGDEYFIGGEDTVELSKGLTAFPMAGSNGPAGDFIELPVSLTETQKWSVSAHGHAAGENRRADRVRNDKRRRGARPRNRKRGRRGLENETEVGPTTIEGANPDVTGVSNGFASFRNGSELNASDGHAVKLSHIFFFGSGEVGPLSTSGAELGVGSSIGPAGGLKAAGVALDPTSEVTFHISGPGATPGIDFSQLAAAGPVALAGARILVTVTAQKEGVPCPTLVPGQTFTFITTTGPLTGGFSNAPEHGTELPLFFGAACGARSQSMRISYHESGATETVTGTVEAVVKEQQESREQREAAERQQAKEQLEAKQRQEAIENASKGGSGGVLGTTEASPNATIAGRSFSVNPAGRFTIKLRCASSAKRCAGTITLRTVRAVSAAIRGRAAKRKAVVTLAVGSFDIPGGQQKTVTLHLTAAGKRLLSHSHVLAARAIVLARNASGVAHTSATTLTLRQSTHKHG